MVWANIDDSPALGRAKVHPRAGGSSASRDAGGRKGQERVARNSRTKKSRTSRPALKPGGTAATEAGRGLELPFSAGRVARSASRYNCWSNGREVGSRRTTRRRRRGHPRRPRAKGRNAGRLRPGAGRYSSCFFPPNGISTEPPIQNFLSELFPPMTVREWNPNRQWRFEVV